MTHQAAGPAPTRQAIDAVEACYELIHAVRPLVLLAAPLSDSVFEVNRTYGSVELDGAGQTSAGDLLRAITEKLFQLDAMEPPDINEISSEWESTLGYLALAHLAAVHLSVTASDVQRVDHFDLRLEVIPERLYLLGLQAVLHDALTRCDDDARGGAWEALQRAFDDRSEVAT
ncbi:MAG: hypothetical protein IH968_05850 [Gemmatimonadetes bacterium]|nr:hypothetical protein [Gemmatimonadota bacterium]